MPKKKFRVGPKNRVGWLTVNTHVYIFLALQLVYIFIVETEMQQSWLGGDRYCDRLRTVYHDSLGHGQSAHLHRETNRPAARVPKILLQLVVLSFMSVSNSMFLDFLKFPLTSQTYSKFNGNKQ